MAQDSPSRKQDQYIVRFPDGMRDRLKDAAAENGRSMNAEIIQRLDESFEGRSALSDKVADAAFVRGIQIGLIEAILLEDDPMAALLALRQRLQVTMDFEKLRLSPEEQERRDAEHAADEFARDQYEEAKAAMAANGPRRPVAEKVARDPSTAGSEFRLRPPGLRPPPKRSDTPSSE